MIDLKADLSFLDRVVLAARRPNLRAAFNESKRPVRFDIRDHKQQRTGPDGAWAPRAASTKERAKRGRGRPRKDLGRLPTSNTLKAERDRLRVTSRAAWSEVQRSGGTVGRGSKILGRDWMYVGAQALDAVAQVVVRHVKRMLFGG